MQKRIKIKGMVLGAVTLAACAGIMGGGETYADAGCNPSATSIADAVCLQDVNSVMMSGMTVGTGYTLKDSRDGQSYTIAKLKDGNVWMTKNLNLGDTANYPLAVTQLDSTNTNITNGSTIAASTFAGSTWKKTSGSGTSTAPEYISVSGVDSTSQTPYGTLYNYCAASANTYCYDGGYGVGDATSDLCPAGWRLPTSGANREFSNLYALYNNTDFNGIAKMRDPISDDGAAFAFAGYSYSSTPTNQGSGGRYWSSTQLDGNNMRYLSLGTHVFPSDVSSRGYGYSVRCILRFDVREKLESGEITMQDFSENQEEFLEVMQEGREYTLVDSRDEQSYTIAKLADGKVWMIDNLNLGAVTLTKDLTSENTNLATTVLAATFNGWRVTMPVGTYDNGEFMSISGTDSTSGTKYGTLYNYYAASAGTISGENNTNNASYDICPAGWRLPTGGDGGELQSLYNNYNTFAKMHASITNNGAAFALAGFFYSGTLPKQGETGGYWSSTSHDNSEINFMYYLDLIAPSSSSSDGAVYSNDAYPRSNGYSIRCVLKDAPKSDAGEDEDEDAGVKVPDTGIFSSENSGVIIASLSIGGVALMAGVMYLVLRSLKNNNRVKIK